MTFTDVKSLWGEWAMGRPWIPRPSPLIRLFAVMLTRSLSPEQLSDERIDAIIEKKGAVGPMYLHLGNNYVIKNSEIIGIFDIRNKRTNLYRLFLKPQLGTSKVLDLTDAYPPASCIVTSDKIILSGISSKTLMNR